MIKTDDIPNLTIGHVQNNDFEASYLKVRSREKRVYSDEEVRLLPELPKNHLQRSEWMLRAKSLKRFITYIQSNKDLKILEIGCGNGWFCGKIDPYTKETIGADINLTELKQAAKLFDNIAFLHHDFQLEVTIAMQVDMIVFNASFQYFEFPKKLLKNLTQYLNENGEIHIIDTPFYTKEQQSLAAYDSQKYYDGNNASEMNQYYHHHSFDDLPEYELMYQSQSRIVRKFIPDMPFPWLKIKKSNLD